MKKSEIYTKIILKNNNDCGNMNADKKYSDYYEIYKQGVTRLDIISHTYYGNPNYDWLIMMANPEYGSMEFNIPNNAQIRIPYPLDMTIQEYEARIKKHFDLY